MYHLASIQISYVDSLLFYPLDLRQQLVHVAILHLLHLPQMLYSRVSTDHMQLLPVQLLVNRIGFPLSSVHLSHCFKISLCFFQMMSQLKYFLLIIPNGKALLVDLSHHIVLPYL